MALPLAGMEVVIVAPHILPQEHYASRVYIHRWHPFWFWFYRKMGWSTSKCFDVGRGRRLYRRQAYIVGNQLFCDMEFADRMRTAAIRKIHNDILVRAGLDVG